VSGDLAFTVKRASSEQSSVERVDGKRVGKTSSWQQRQRHLVIRRSVVVTGTHHAYYGTGCLVFQDVERVAGYEEPGPFIVHVEYVDDKQGLSCTPTSTENSLRITAACAREENKTIGFNDGRYDMPTVTLVQ